MEDHGSHSQTVPTNQRIERGNPAWVGIDDRRPDRVLINSLFESPRDDLRKLVGCRNLQAVCYATWQPQQYQPCASAQYAFIQRCFAGMGPLRIDRTTRGDGTKHGKRAKAHDVPILATWVQCKPNTRCFTTCIAAWSRVGQPERAEQLWHELIDLQQRLDDPHLAPDTAAGNALLLAWARSGRLGGTSAKTQNRFV
jgi:pentatricopeptide repeat protein